MSDINAKIARMVETTNVGMLIWVLAYMKKWKRLDPDHYIKITKVDDMMGEWVRSKMGNRYSMFSNEGMFAMYFIYRCLHDHLDAPNFLGSVCTILPGVVMWVYCGISKNLAKGCENYPTKSDALTLVYEKARELRGKTDVSEADVREVMELGKYETASSILVGKTSAENHTKVMAAYMSGAYVDQVSDAFRVARDQLLEAILSLENKGGWTLDKIMAKAIEMGAWFAVEVLLESRPAYFDMVHDHIIENADDPELNALVYRMIEFGWWDRMDGIHALCAEAEFCMGITKAYDHDLPSLADPHWSPIQIYAHYKSGRCPIYLIEMLPPGSYLGKLLKIGNDLYSCGEFNGVIKVFKVGEPFKEPEMDHMSKNGVTTKWSVQFILDVKDAVSKATKPTETRYIQKDQVVVGNSMAKRDANPTFIMNEFSGDVVDLYWTLHHFRACIPKQDTAIYIEAVFASRGVEIADKSLLTF